MSRSATYPHGLHLVRKLATACGAQRGIGCGLVGWFRIDVPPPMPLEVSLSPRLYSAQLAP